MSEKAQKVLEQLLAGESPEGIVIWHDGKITESAWINGGGTAVHVKPGETILETVEKCLHLIEHNLRTCSRCGVFLKKSEIAGSHFAGTYCVPCWESYKSANSRKCRMCGKPYYACNC